MKFSLGSLFVAVVLSSPAFGAQQAPPPQGAQSGNIINIQISRTVPTVNYLSRGSTKIGFEGTALMPRAEGQAKVEAKNGVYSIQAQFQGLADPASLGPAYLVYVLWAITPEGRVNNLGQLPLDGSKSKLDVTTRLQNFGMIVTAEPYFAVSFPSEDVVLANTVLSNTKGGVTPVSANVELLQRGKYGSLNLTPIQSSPGEPLDLLQARNAVRIAQAQGADKYAPESFAKAQQALAQAEDYQKRKQKSPTLTAARQAVQAAEDARTISAKRQEDERIANEQQQAATKAAEAKAAAAEAKAAQEAEAQEKLAAQQAAAQEAAARAAAQQDAERQQQAAAQAEREKQELRARLLEQFNRVLPTTDTSRGLVVNMGDVLFDTGKADLRTSAQLALARVAGVVSNYPSLHLAVQGYTDSTGGAAFNQTLSEQRADAVRDFLTSQGLSSDSLSATGFGATNFVADNSTPDGRQKNRRVEIVISGEVIGTKIGGSQ